MFPFTKLSVPLNEKGATKICRAIADNRLAQFSKTHALTLNHFLLEMGRWSDNTILHGVAANGQLDIVQEILKERGERLTLEHLLRQNKGGQSPFSWAVNEGHLPQVAEILKASGETLTVEHFLMKSKSIFRRDPGLPPLPSFLTPTVLDMAAQRRRLDQVFSASLWANRVGQMMELWRHVPEKDRSQVDFQAAVEKTILAGLPAGPDPKENPFAGAVRASAVNEKGQITGRAPQEPTHR